MTTKFKLLFASLAFAGITTLSAQTVGYIQYTIAGSSNGTSQKITFISPPFITTATTTGLTNGVINSLTSNTVTVTGAGWTASDLVTNGPTYFYVKSGSQAGLMLLVTANTTDTLTLDTETQNLTTLGITTGASGDAFELIQGDTVANVFGTPAEGIIGGTASQFSAGQTDKIILRDNSGVTRTIYYSTESNQWRRSGSGANQGTIRVSPYSGAIYYRISTTPLVLLSSGVVPSVQSRQLVPRSGVTFLSRFFPTDTTLGALGLENMTDWRSTNDAGVTTTTADKVIVTDNSGIVRQFYHDGTSWKRGGSGSSQNSVIIPAGSAIQVSRFGSTTNTEQFSQALPY